jgi:predicted GNAT family N-acyltransferase
MRPGWRVIPARWMEHAAALTQVRREVFVDEQGVPEELEWDGRDAACAHFLAVDAHGIPIGCARLLPDGHIGRMAVLREWRAQGVGTALLRAALAEAKQRGQRIARLSAQVVATGFYRKHGFKPVGKEYLDAGIPHVDMERKL